MKFSVIIPAYNEEEYLPATLAALKDAANETNLPAEIIVVDNESADKTAQIAKNFGAKIVSEREHNIAKVRNAGAKTANGDVLIFIDADTLVPKTLFHKIADAMREEKCSGGAVAVSYEEFQRKWIKYYLLGWRFWASVFNMKQGAAQFCRKSVFEKVQGYDETIYMGEDISFYWKLSEFARKTGGFLTFIENPKVITSTRRFDKMSVWKTLLLTHPLIIGLARRKKSAWKEWYEKAIR